MKFPLKSVIAAIALTSAMPAFALDVISPCDPTRPTPDASACSGYFEDNLLGGGPKIDLQDEALDMLVGGDFPDIDWTAVGGTKDFFSISGDILTFDAALLGEQIIGIHFGGAGEFGQSVTVFYLFDFAGPTLSIDLNQQGFSDAVLYSPPGTPTQHGVPEPTTWAMMLMGFGAVGFAMRRRKRSQPTIRQIA